MEAGRAEEGASLEGQPPHRPAPLQQKVEFRFEKGEAVLPELEELSRNPLVKGIRRIIQFEADPDFCLRPDFIRGVRLLPRFGWTFDICISHDQVPTALRFVERNAGAPRQFQFGLRYAF